jgi:hypothetical protein
MCSAVIPFFIARKGGHLGAVDTFLHFFYSDVDIYRGPMVPW